MAGQQQQEEHPHQFAFGQPLTRFFGLDQGRKQIVAQCLPPLRDQPLKVVDNFGEFTVGEQGVHHTRAGRF